MTSNEIKVTFGKKVDSPNLSRDDFDGGPVSLDEIEPGLWLGNVSAATDMNALKVHNISHILTVDSCPLPSHITQISSITTKFIKVSDVPKEDFLGHFVECIDFISDTLNAKHSILVHCYFGVSRSATIVIAYLMRKYRLNYDHAFQRVKAKRRFVGPNTGFVTQLKLFYRMGFTIDVAHPKYKQYRLKLAADNIKKAKILPPSFMDLVKPDPGLIQVKPEPKVYRCKKCRRIIATKNNILTHKPKQVQQQPESENTQTIVVENVLVERVQGLSLNSETSKHSSESELEFCQKMFFVEPIAWMKDIVNSTQGRLYCPKCSSKLGNFSWLMGCQCPCGNHVSPAFYLVPSKVEYSTVVQNVQVTI